MSFAWAFLSGIEANNTGTGRLMQHLQDVVLKRGKFDGTIVYNPKGQSLTAEGRAMLVAIPHLVVFHPQLIGMRDTLMLMQDRATRALPSHLYLLDNSFFCVRSYNHLDHEGTACMRCVGPGQALNATLNGCQPWPERDPFASVFIAGLEELVRSGAVRLLAQTQSQIALARRHFGETADIAHVGLWCADWTAYVDAFTASGRAEGDADPTTPTYDVVYHGSRDLAKGIGWVLALAARTPELRYLIPIDRGAVNVEAPPNVAVAAMRWENGLHEAVRSARLVLAPSLWSSPCEGALIKSILIAKATAVVDVPSAFSAEIPSNVVARFSQDPDEAAQTLRAALAQNWRPDPAARAAWVSRFHAFNEGVAERLLPA